MQKDLSYVARNFYKAQKPPFSDESENTHIMYTDEASKVSRRIF
jgi:hypothetical protein